MIHPLWRRGLLKNIAALALVAVLPATVQALELDVSGNGSVGPEDVDLVYDALYSSDAAADVNDDGRVDFRDLALVKQGQLTTVEFEYMGTTVSESVGMLAVTLQSADPFDGGEVHFTVTGTAADGSDYQILTTESVTVSGSEASILVDILDDDQLDPVEWITIGLVRGAGYRLGAFTEHTIRIEDNDALWIGSFVPDGNTTFEAVDFALELKRTASAVEGTLNGRGGLIPEIDPAPALSGIVFDAIAFNADPVAIPLPVASAREPGGATRSLGDALWTAELEFAAGVVTSTPVCLESDALNCIDSDALEATAIDGSGFLRIESASAGHLNQEIPGTYRLYKQAPAPSPTEIDLTDLEN